jgi:predicted urease superfamily metal-dependent hydrolase
MLDAHWDDLLDERNKLEAENAQLRKALEKARTAIKSLSADALGKAGTDRYQWYLRDELLTKIDQALAATPQPPEHDNG